MGEFHSISFGMHEIFYSCYFAPLASKKGFYHICSRDGEPIVEEPLRGVKGNYPFGDRWNWRYMFINVSKASGFPLLWCTLGKFFPWLFRVGGLSICFYDWHAKLFSVVSCHVSLGGEAVVKLAMEIPRRFCWVNFLVSREALCAITVFGVSFSLNQSSDADRNLSFLKKTITHFSGNALRSQYQ